MQSKKWSEEEVNLLKGLVNKTSFREMVPQFPGRTTISLQKKAWELGITNSFKPSKYRHNKNFFQTSNLVNSYWAGWICGRGYGYPRRFTICIGSRPGDHEHLTRLKTTIEYTGDIKLYPHKKFKTMDTNSNAKAFLMPTLTIAGAKQIMSDLTTNFGFSSSKAERIPPSAIKSNLDLSLAFIIGLLDSDGYITISNTSPNQYRGRIHLSVFNLQLALWVDEILLNCLQRSSISSNPHITQGSQLKELGSSYHLVYHSKDAIAIAQKMIEINTPHLARNLDRPDLREAILFYSSYGTKTI